MLRFNNLKLLVIQSKSESYGHSSVGNSLILPIIHSSLKNQSAAPHCERVSCLQAALWTGHRIIGRVCKKKKKCALLSRSEAQKFQIQTILPASSVL